MKRVQTKCANKKPASLLNSRAFWVAFASAAVAGVIAANAHLVYVALRTQPACVAHAKDVDDAEGAYRAAKSGCTWRAEDGRGEENE